MKLYINGRFLTQRLTGVQRYAVEIVKSLDEIVSDTDDIEILIPPEKQVTTLHLKNIKQRVIGKFKGQLWVQMSLPHYVHQNKGRLLTLAGLAPIFAADYWTVHDITVVRCPETFGRKFRWAYKFEMKLLIPMCKRVFTVSEFSKKEISSYYHINPQEIVVAPNAWQHLNEMVYDENALKKYNLEKESYCFSISSLKPNKNFRWIAEVAKRNSGLTFAVAGSINKKVFADGLGFECPANMKLLGYVSDEEAKTLMRDCKAFLFPTLYEGFGIPPLEAMSAGAKHIVVSNIEVMHEIFGDSVIYIDPKKCDYDLNMLILHNENYNTKPLENYSWKKSADILYKNIKSYDQ